MYIYMCASPQNTRIALHTNQSGASSDSATHFLMQFAAYKLLLAVNYKRWMIIRRLWFNQRDTYKKVIDHNCWIIFSRFRFYKMWPDFTKNHGLSHLVLKLAWKILWYLFCCLCFTEEKIFICNKYFFRLLFKKKWSIFFALADESQLSCYIICVQDLLNVRLLYTSCHIFF